MKLSKLPDHVLNKIKIPEDPDACWEWLGEKSFNGYGRAWFRGIRQSAHRLVYQLLVGGVIEGKELDHKCCNRACVNPRHVKKVTHKKNCQLREKRRRAREREEARP